MTLILSVDPGKSTGYLIVNSDDPLTIISAGQVTPLEFVTWMTNVLAGIGEVVCEHFIIGQRTLKAVKSSQEPLDVEGWLRLECQRRGKPFTIQRNADAMMITDGRLQTQGWWNFGKGRADRDVRSAARHMTKYLVDRGYLPY